MWYLEIGIKNVNFFAHFCKVDASNGFTKCINQN